MNDGLPRMAISGLVLTYNVNGDFLMVGSFHNVFSSSEKLVKGAK